LLEDLAHAFGFWLVDDESTVSTVVTEGDDAPIHMPFFFEAATLSRILSPVSSRSNWANDKSTFSVSRPIEVVVLNCWVTDTKLTPCQSNTSMILAKSARERVRRSTL
jgi:hypothetical protein